jgi:RND family efflux transporter MFP subunit
VALHRRDRRHPSTRLSVERLRGQVKALTEENWLTNLQGGFSHCHFMHTVRLFFPLLVQCSYSIPGFYGDDVMACLRILFLFVPLFAIGCTNSTKPAAAPAEKVKVEADLAFTNLTKEAYVRLKIKTQKTTVTEVNERLALTGWIMAKPGNEVTLTAPTAGYVHFPKNHAPIAGEAVEAKDELLTLDPVLSPVEKIQVAALKISIESDLVKAQTTLRNAEIELDRTAKLVKAKAKNQQELEKAQEKFDHAKEDVASATKKLTSFQPQRMTLKAPRDGKILQLHVGPGQYVPVSAPVITIIDLQPIWIRVPVPEFDLPQVDPKESVDVSWKNSNHNQTDKPVFFKAKYVGRVAQVDPVKHTAELWYELLPTKEADRFVKDQMVTVHIPLGKKEKGTVVPYSAIVFDVHGQAWVYLERAEEGGKHKFERRFVELVTAVDNGLLVRGSPSLSDGDIVVTQGAAVLFSRDFFKTPVPGEEG